MTLAQRASATMHTISVDTGGRFVGGDHSADQTEAASWGRAPRRTTTQLYRATIEVFGRARSVVDTRPALIVVPAMGAAVTPG